MKKEKTPTTNAMRLLEKSHIPFETGTYEYDESDLSGAHAAEVLGIDPDIMFKTLVTRGERMGILVFCIPVCAELDLKKCAASSGDKRVELIHVKELVSLTGYVRGGCSPVGMKKKFPTFFSQKVKDMDLITVSAGIRGIQLLLNAAQLVDYVEAQCCDITKD